MSESEGTEALVSTRPPEHPNARLDLYNDAAEGRQERTDG
jgi:hypothetical protein